jgi:diguanylate cyclase (GGDEF)-like protein
MGTVDAPSGQVLPTEAHFENAVLTVNDRRTVIDAPLDAQGPDTAVLMNVLRRVIANRQLGDELAHLLLYDPLTDLPNRILFQDRLNHALAQAERYGRVVALLMIGLAWSKSANIRAGDTARHPDVAEIARQLRRCTRSSDTVARMDDVEFAVILPDVERGEHAGVVARRILEVLAPSYVVGQRSDDVPVGIGIGLYPRDSQDGETLLCNARTALRHARRHEGQHYRFFAHLSVF